MTINQNPGNKPDRIRVNVKNADTVTIPVGSPVTLAFNGTDDGVAVVLPANAGTGKAYSGLYGIAMSSIPVQAQGEAQVYGFCMDVIILRATRATTDSWASGATITDQLGLVLDTGGLYLKTSGASVASTLVVPNMILAATLNSFAGSASSTADTRTAVTQMGKAFLRLM